MEMALVIIAAVVVLWFLGFVKSIRVIADTANNEVLAYNTVHKKKIVEKLKDNEITADDWAKAQAVIDAAKAFKLD